jgi:hypothetical protein
MSHQIIATIDKLAALGPDKFVLHMGCGPAVNIEVRMGRLEAETLRALCAEALARTQDYVEDPIMLARVQIDELFE